MIPFAEPFLEATLTLIREVHSNVNQVVHKLCTTDNLKNNSKHENQTHDHN
jgi:hypothetical protein